MKKILVISWFYPPINSSEGLVTYKLLRNSKLQYDVCMQESNASWSYGNKEYLPECENVRKIPIQADTLEIWKNKTIEYFNAHKKEYDIIMTRSMPPESHEIGLKIKEIKPEIKWIASFGDPIANNPFVLKTIKKISPYSLQNRYIRPMGIREIISPKRMIKNEIWKKRMKKEQIPYKKEQELEDAIITKSDYIIMNNPYQKQYMTGKYSDAIKAKAIVLPHSFDYSLYDKEIDAENSGKIRMVYIGHLDDIRTPHLFLKAIASMKKEHSDLAEKLEVFFYGNMSAKEKVYLLDNELLDMNIFFAAKLADYIGADRPIFGITMFDGAGADVVRDVNGLTVSYTVDEIKNYLYLILYEGYQIEVNEENRKKYDAVNVAKKFDDFVENKILH